jgi:hypothetical protein
MKHGRSAYLRKVCKCDICTQAAKQYMKDYRSSTFGKQKHSINARKKARRDAMCREWMKANRPDVFKRIWQAVESGS